MFNNYMNIRPTTDLTKMDAAFDKPNYNAFYRGIVVDTHDPQDLGRVRIRIPSMHGMPGRSSSFLYDDELPWATPAIFLGAANDMGTFIVPEKGTRVIVSFELNDPNHPIYFGGIPTKIGYKKTINDTTGVFNGEEQDVLNDDRLSDIKTGSERVIYKSLKGATIVLDDRDGKEYIKIIDQAGQQIIMQNDGEGLNRRGGTTNPPASASIKIVSNGKVEIDADTFKLNTNRNEIDIYDYDVKLNKEG